MKKLLLLLFISVLTLQVSAQVPTDTATLRQRINQWIVTNGTKQITANQVNQLFNGIANLMKAYSIDSAYRINDTLFLVRRGGYTTIKVTLSSGGVASEIDPTVPFAVKLITASDIAFWNKKQDSVKGSTTIDVIANVVSAKNGTALWNANKLHGRNVPDSIPVVGQVLQYDGADWVPKDPMSIADSMATLRAYVNKNKNNALLDSILTTDVAGVPKNLYKGALAGSVMNYANGKLNLGGSLTQDVHINLAGYNLLFETNNTSTGSFRYDAYSMTTNKGSSIALGADGTFALQVYTPLDGKAIMLIAGTSSQLTMKDQILSKGMKYFADYSALGAIDSLWIPSINYVRRALHDTALAHPGGIFYNTSIGAGHRVAITGTNDIRSLHAGYGVLYDSTSFAGEITASVDTNTLFPAVRAVRIPKIITITSNTTLNTGYYKILIDASAGNVIVTLPPVSSVYNGTTGIMYSFERIDNSANTASIVRSGGDLLDGGYTSMSLILQRETAKLQAGPSNTWYIEN